MARISDPQMVEDFMRSRTWPHPGSGTAYERISAVLFPGSTAPCISVFVFMLMSFVNIPPIVHVTPA
jgi:hypothetical protein